MPNDDRGLDEGAPFAVTSVLWDTSSLHDVTTGEASRTDMAIGATPCTGRTLPSNDNSPMNTRSCAHAAGICSSTINRAIAIARSNVLPTFLSVDGARFMVILRVGKSNPLDKMAARTRSRDSRQTSSGRPRIVNDGRPGPMCASTKTGHPLIPVTLADRTLHSTSTPIQYDRSLDWSSEGVRHVSNGGDGIEPPVPARMCMCWSAEHHIASMRLDCCHVVLLSPSLSRSSRLDAATPTARRVDSVASFKHSSHR